MSSSGESNDVPPLDDLLVSLDVASRDDKIETENVVLALASRARLDGVPPRRYFASALLVAFKRRNHSTSRAPGLGAGERNVLRTVLEAIAAKDPEATTLVLPLVPLYGSWRDLLVLAESMLPEPKNDDATNIDVGQFPIVDAICQLFADQMKVDAQNGLVGGEPPSASAELPPSASASAAESASLPSTAAKYAPHEGRHGGKGPLCAKNKALADAIALKIGCCPPDSSSNKRALRASYRAFRASLNARLAAAGHLLEPLLAAKRLDAIQFHKAPKGGLAKVRKALLKDPACALRWKKAMAKSEKAVPDIDDVPRAAAEAREEAEEDAEMRIMPRRVAKAITTIQSSRNALVAEAKALLGQLKSAGPEGAEKGGGGDSGSRSDVENVLAKIVEGESLPTLPVVLTVNCDGDVSDELLLAAFLLARAQRLPLVSVDGELVDVADDVAEDEEGADAGDAAGEGGVRAPSLPDFDGFKARVGTLKDAIAARTGDKRLEVSRLLDGGLALLKAVGRSRGDDGRGSDIVVICSSFASASGEPDKLKVAVGVLKAEGMRVFMVHRLRTVAEDVGGIPFNPRPGLRPMPPRGSETVDVCFVLDLTGSMSSWIDQCKSHISSIISSLRDDAAVRTVRVGFAGYRDWGERASAANPRIVTTNFVPMENVEVIVQQLRDSHASGGGDGPEDVVIAFEAINNFTWQGDVRVCVFIADAPAHGYAIGGDDYPAGLCPDQRTPLPELVAQLATAHGVDLLCTKIGGSYTDKMFNMFESVYKTADPQGRGFGVLDIGSGTSKFKAAILGSLSKALCALIAPSVEAAGVQTFDGQTVSALATTLHASLRETIDAAASLLRKPDAAEEKKGEDEKGEIVDAAIRRVEELEAELAAAEAARDVYGGFDDDGGGDSAIALLRSELEVATAAAETVKARPAEARAARSDAARLHAALEAKDLHPVRLALGLALPTDSLAVEAAAALIRAGVCVGDMEAAGYPDLFVKAMQEAAAMLAKRL